MLNVGISVGILFLIALSIILIRFTLIMVVVQGMSMEPLLKDGDRVLIFRYWPQRWLRRGQIILVQHLTEIAPSRKEPVMPFSIKRLAALPGETITTTLDLVPSHTWLPRQQGYDEHGKKSWIIPPGHLFVLGDNSSQSLDSRVWGPISIQSLRGVKLFSWRRVLTESATGLTRPISLSQRQITPSGLLSGQRAPYFDARTLQGEYVTLESFRGKCVALLFIAPSPFCRDAVTMCIALAEQMLHAGISIVFVSSTGVEPTSSFIDDLQVTLPVLVAPRASNPFLADYCIAATPAYCLLDEHGIVMVTGSLISIAQIGKYF